MTLQQLEYICAVDKYKQFATGADHCCVTQATLSMMVKKLEDEIGIQIFDRAKQPIRTTVVGEKVIAQAKAIVKEAHIFSEMFRCKKKR